MIITQRIRKSTKEKQIIMNSEIEMLKTAMEKNPDGSIKNQPEWEQFYNKYQPIIMNIAKRHTSNEDDCLDITNDIFIKFIRDDEKSILSKFDFSKNFIPWISIVIKNECINKFKRNKHTLYVGTEEDETNNLSSMYTNKIDESIMPNEDRINKEETIEFVQEVIEELQDDFKKIIKLKYFEDLSYNEIAEELEIPLGTVMSRLHNAKKKVKEIINQDKTRKEKVKAFV
jgi:RNA polymerase sigma factor (sigma-70 family)